MTLDNGGPSREQISFRIYQNIRKRTTRKETLNTFVVSKGPRRYALNI